MVMTIESFEAWGVPAVVAQPEIRARGAAALACLGPGFTLRAPACQCVANARPERGNRTQPCITVDVCS
jgi:hypothetical protein